MDRSSASGFAGSDPPGETTLLPAEQTDHASAQFQSAMAKGPLGVDYIPTEEETRVFKECNQESFWYRSVPLSVSSMALTQLLISRGTLTASPRFGSVPKVLFAGACGYLAGKLSYMKTCQEKFKQLENSPLGDALRKRAGHRPPFGCSEDERRSEGPLQSESQIVYSAPYSYPQSHERMDDEEVQKRRAAEPVPPQKQVKKNKYGDAWEE